MGPAGSMPPEDPGLESAAHRVLTTLRDEIVTAQLEPGQIIRETETASRLGVSKTPVREALQALLWEGFVMVFPRRGYMVRHIGLNDVREVMDMRLALEPLITAQAARNRSQALVDELEAALACQLDESRPFEDRLGAATRFHQMIVTSVGNKRAERLLHTYFDETTRMHYLFAPASDHVVSEAELTSHRAILDAIIARDAEAAQQAMQEHLQESNEALLRSFY